MKQQREYQVKGTDTLSVKVQQGKRKIVMQLATGGGKTVMFAGLTKRFLAANPEMNVLIAVHREVLLDQARRTIYDWYGIIAEKVTKETKFLPNAKVWVAMVETACNRLRKRPNYFPNVGLLIIDEAHVGNFKKLHQYYPEAVIVGFTATPLYPSKKHPMKKDYDDIVTCIDVKGLIETWQDDHTQGLVPNMTFRVKNVDRSELKVASNGLDFDEAQMGAVYSTGKHVSNCVDAYERFLLGKKTIVFNCNVEHSKLVDQAFRDRGYNSRHLDANSPDRKEIIEWFKNTPDAVLQNVGILVAGFDEPSIMGVIENLATLSLSKWLQTTGRGSRPYPGKEYFVIVDMGGNTIAHGDWCAQRDWEDIFFNPEKPRDGGIAGTKECPACECLVPTSARVCKFCGAEFMSYTEEPKYDTQAVAFELFSDANTVKIDVKEVIAQSQGKRDYYALHAIKHKLVAHYKVETMTEDVAYKLLSLFQKKIAEWCKEKSKPYNQWHQKTTAEWLFEELFKVYGWKPEPLEISL